MDYARPQITQMHGYTPGEQPQLPDVIKLNTNENPYPPSPLVVATLAAFNTDMLRRYPDPVANELRAAAAARYSLPSRDWVLAGNGSDDLLTIAMRTFVDPGQVVVFPWPTYSLYPVLCEIQGARAVSVELDAQFALSADFFATASAAKLVFIARPNAPTGTSFPLAEIRRICAECAGVVWIDEAYADFADDNCLPLVVEYDNVIVSRTLSKSAGLAGLRLGLAFANPSNITEMMKVKDSYNVSQITQALGCASLKDAAYTQMRIAQIRATRAAVTARLTELGFDVLPSQANFIFARPPVPAIEYVAALKKRNIYVRHFALPRTNDYVRITIGTEAEMEQLLGCTRQLVS